MSDFIEVPIKTPLFVYEDSPCVRINSKYVRQAHNQGKLLKVTCMGHTHYMTAEQCKSKWKKVKEVFLFENHPMKMWEGFVIDNSPPETPKEMNFDIYVENMLKLRKIARNNGIKI
jgi:hypothetical protein